MRDISGAKPGLEAACFVEAVHPWIGAAALQENVMAVPRPGLVQRGAHDGSAMALPAKRGMGHDIFKKSMLTARAQEVGRRDQHAGRNDPGIRFGYEHNDAVM